MHQPKSMIAAAVLAAALGLHAQTQDGRSTDPVPTSTTQSASQSAWQKFRAENAGDWFAIWNPATRTPESIYGEGLKLGGRVETIDEARGHATRLLAKYSDLLGLGSSTFVESIGQKVINKVHVLVYDQYFRGLKVISGRADVRIHDVGVVSLFGTRAVPVPADFNTTPALDPQQAIAIGYQHEGVEPAVLGPLMQPKQPKLVIWADTELKQQTAVRLAWEVSVDRLDKKKVGRSYVDALNGQVLAYATDYHECSWAPAHGAAPEASQATEESGSGEFVWGAESDVSSMSTSTNVTGSIKGWTNIGLDNRDASFVLTNIPLKGVRVTIPSTAAFAFTDDNGNFNITNPGTTAVSVAINFNNAERQNGVTASTGTTLSILTTATPGVPLNVQFYTSTAASTDRAQTNAYHGIHEVNEYCRSIIGALPAATDLIHTNVNLASTCNAFYSGNTVNFYAVGGGCVNTSYQTVVEHEWGHGLDDRYGGIFNNTGEGLSEGWGDIIAMYKSGQPIVGPNFTTAGGSIRNGVNSVTYPCTGCAVHTAGQVWMGFAWDLRVRLIARLGATAGANQAAKDVIGSIVANATNQANAVLQVFVLDDNDGNLANGTPYCTDIVAACGTKSLPVPAGLTCTANRYMYSPAAYEATEGNTNNTFPFGGGTNGQFSYMQIHGDMRGRAKTINALNFRQDGITTTVGAAKTITADLYMGGGNYATFGPNYLSNYTTARTLVANTTFSLPAWTTPPVLPPAEFTSRLPLSAPYVWNGANDLIWEARVLTMSVASGRFADAVSYGAGADLGTDTGTNYGTGCFSTGKLVRHSMAATFTSSRIAGQHALSFTATNGVNSAPGVMFFAFTQANIPLTGLCGNILFTGTTINLNGTYNASGTMSFGPIPVTYSGALIGLPTYTQAACLDTARADAFKVSVSNGIRNLVPAPAGDRFARIWTADNATAATGSGSSFGYTLMLALD